MMRARVVAQVSLHTINKLLGLSVSCGVSLHADLCVACSLQQLP